jgi:TolA-binding protein
MFQSHCPPSRRHLWITAAVIGLLSGPVATQASPPGNLPQSDKPQRTAHFEERKTNLLKELDVFRTCVQAAQQPNDLKSCGIERQKRRLEQQMNRLDQKRSRLRQREQELQQQSEPDGTPM